MFFCLALRKLVLNFGRNYDAVLLVSSSLWYILKIHCEYLKNSSTKIDQRPKYFPPWFLHKIFDLFTCNTFETITSTASQRNTQTSYSFMHSSKFYIQSNYFVSHMKCTIFVTLLVGCRIPFYEYVQTFLKCLRLYNMHAWLLSHYYYFPSILFMHRQMKSRENSFRSQCVQKPCNV